MEPRSEQPDASSPGENLPRGVAVCTLAFSCISLVSALGKQASLHASTEVIVLFQNVICFLCIAPFVLRHGLAHLRTHRIWLHMFRAATGAGSFLCLFFAITLMPLANAVLLCYSAPLWIPLLAWVINRQTLTSRTLAGVISGFIGIILVIHPSNAEFNLGVPIALLGSLCLAFTLLSIRRLNETEPNSRILFYYFLFSSVLVLPFALDDWKTPDTVALTYLIGIGVVYLTAQALIILAYRYASAVILSPLIYSVIPVSVLINWIVWDRPPTLLEFAGIVFVVAGGVFALTGGQQDADELT